MSSDQIAGEYFDLVEYQEYLKATVSIFLELQKMHGEPDPQDADMAIAQIPGLHVTAIHALQQAGVESVSDLGEVSAEDLRALKGIGPGSLNKIREALAVMNRNLADEDPVDTFDATVRRNIETALKTASRLIGRASHEWYPAPHRRRRRPR